MKSFTLDPSEHLVLKQLLAKKESLETEIRLTNQRYREWGRAVCKQHEVNLSLYEIDADSGLCVQLQETN